jgi:UDP-N-acetylglucosamine 1-carboxyvinyltransferase
MDRILIRGGVPLSGTIKIGGAKNAALPLMAASLLTAEPLVLANLPDLADITTMANLLVQHGVSINVGDTAPPEAAGRVFELSARHSTSTTAPYDLVRKMRDSFLVLGPLVARCGRGRVSLPGGCDIGVRPVDLHIKGLQRPGAEVELSEDYIEARGPKGLPGAEIPPYCSRPSEFFPLLPAAVTTVIPRSVTFLAASVSGSVRYDSRMPAPTDILTTRML